MTDEQQEQITSSLEGKTIALAIPGDKMTNFFTLSLVNLIDFFNKNNINYFISNERRADMTNCRNRVLLYGQRGSKDALPMGGFDYDYILWLDTDMIFRPEHLLSLISRDKDVISGCYAQTPSRMVAGYLRDSGMAMLANKSVYYGGAIEVDFFGLGFALFKYGVFEHIGYPWFYPRMNTYKDIDVWTHTGEDVSLCRKLKENYNYSLFLDLDVRLGHQKTIVMDLEQEGDSSDKGMVEKKV